MKNKASEQDVVNLLSSMKNSENGYPSDLIASRRDTFTKQAAAMAVLVRAGIGETTPTGSGQAGAASATTTTNAGVGLSIGTLLETALVVAIVVEAGAAAYIYRDKIADFINSKRNPGVELVVSPPSENPAMMGTETPIEIPTGTVVSIISETPAPSVTFLPVGSNPSNTDTNGGTTQIILTPAPNDHPGLHIGQTKQPTDEGKSEEKKNDK